MIRCRVRSCILSATVLVAAPGGVQAGAFHFPTWDERFEADGAGPETVAVADVTGDGRNDVLVATGNFYDSEADATKGSKVFVYVQLRDGTLADPILTPHGIEAMGGNLRLQAGDLDRDGMTDIAISHSGGVTIGIARGDGRFDFSRVSVPGSAGLQGFAIADLDGDRNLDLVRQVDSYGTTILFGNGDGGIRERRTLDVDAEWHQMLRIGDVTGDGMLDLVMSNSRELRVHPGLGNGEFHTPRVHPYHVDEPRGYWGLAIADTNSDGRRDILTTTASSGASRGLYVFEQRSDGTLTVPPRDVPTYAMPEVTLAADLDHNGYEDILVLHGGWYALGYYMQDHSGLAAEQHVWVPYATHYNPHGMATGDVNGDGCTDVAITDYNNALQILHGRNCYEPWTIATDDPHDFDGDGMSDIVWRNDATGQNVMWRSGNSAARVALRGVADAAWRIVGAGDFDGDGRSDLFWRHAETGTNSIWGGADPGSSVAVSRVGDIDWQVVGIGDLDGNGQDDLVWRHRHTGASTIWGGGSPRAARPMTSVTDIDWQIAGVADFDGDGLDDVLWRHRADGRNVIWRAGDIRDSQAMPTVADPAWQVTDVADLDGDGRSDLLWRHAFDGRVESWPSANHAAAAPLSPLSDLSWKVAGAADYSGDGRADVLWRNLRTGANVVWRGGDSNRRTYATRVESLKWTAAR